MYREIKFRGKSTVDGRWLFGYFVLYEGYYSIAEGLMHNPVHPYSIGQFTGLKDKNDKEIYEGEIIFNDDRNENCVVSYHSKEAMFIVKYTETNDEFPLWGSISNLYYSIGNIHDNPELLK